jgi:hypothetical protein
MTTPRNRLIARNVLLVVGVWEASNLAAMLLRVLFIPIGNRLIFTGSGGVVESWLWEGLPDSLIAAVAAVALLWVIEAKKPFSWVCVLAALFLYGASLRAWRWIRHGWRVSPSPADHVGIWVQAFIPAMLCLAIGVWWSRRSTASRLAAS